MVVLLHSLLTSAGDGHDQSALCSTPYHEASLKLQVSGTNFGGKGKVKISLLQAKEAHRVARG
jgi:hypothetical protein